MEDILSDAQEVLDEASGLMDELAEALSDSGIYQFYYVGYIQDLSSAVTLAGLNTGLPDKQPTGGEESVAGCLILVGGDGGLNATREKITRLFNQIGGNGAAIAALYS